MYFLLGLCCLSYCEPRKVFRQGMGELHVFEVLYSSMVNL